MKKIVAAAAAGLMLAGAAFADVSFSYTGKAIMGDTTKSFTKATRNDCLALTLSNDVAGVKCDWDLNGGDKMELDEFYAWMDFALPVGALEITSGKWNGRNVNRVKTEAGDLGQPINPMSCEGQVHGSIQMGMGHALLEEMKYADDGRLLNPSFHDYKLVGTIDMPEVNATIVESFDPSAPYGAKESGEGPVQPTPPAVFNAVYDAIGFRCTEQPLHQEKVLNYLKSIGKNL